VEAGLARVATLAGIVVAATLLAAAPGKTADTYPSGPIVLVIPLPPGGTNDIMARAVADKMSDALGQRIVIENRNAGGSGTVGRREVARAAPDGYTIGIGHWSTHVVNAAVYPLQYDVLDDFAPISLVANNPQLVVSKNAVPAKDLKELIAWVKQNQAKVTQGTAGVGSASHIGGIYFQNLTGTTFQFVPYRGAAPVMQDLLAGQIDITFDQAANSLPQVRAGQIRAYAVTAKTRLASAPDIPTVDEAGLPGFYISVWHGLWAPKGTPKEVLAKLLAATHAALANPTVQKRLAELGQDLPAPEQQNPEALRAHHKAELEKWTPIIKAANIKLE
jgi:tripartite-type tricarboxylate transporter receptor subunit TctC